MKQVLLKAGGAVVEDVPAPGCGPKSVLVRVHYSCISAGTESAGAAAVAMPLYQRALKKPSNVLRAFRMAREHGVAHTLERIRGTSEDGQATGYSAAGQVITVGAEVEGFSIGDRVACAGAGIANHAEVIDVPVNLAVRVPDRLPLEQAATVTLGAIALQGVRRTNPTLGETVGVIGLGIIGQLIVQLLKANGCRVIGVDLDADRLHIARSCGMDEGINPGDADVVERMQWLTHGLGADAVIVAAAAANHEIVSVAMRGCRRKGRVVLVGDVGLNLRREDFYAKELDFLVSTSYGPGRYDPWYENEGQDYPLPYVRWTENRNMSAYLALISEGRISLSAMNPSVVEIDAAPGAYRAFGDTGAKPLLTLLRYPQREDAVARTVQIGAVAVAKTGKVRIALIGAGDFAHATHLPNLARLGDRCELRWVVSRTGAKALATARQYGAPFAGTNTDEALDDPDVDLVLISTRHHLHAELVLRALRKGKHVFVEKPLALSEAQLAPIEAFFAETDTAPVLMTGFNRRYAPAMQQVKKILDSRTGPLIISYRMNAGYLPPAHWVHGKEGGGRNLGEACHIYDLFGFLTQARLVAVQASAVQHLSGGMRRNENFVANVSFDDGSVASLIYTAMGANTHPKERMDIFYDGKVLCLDDFREVTLTGHTHALYSARTIEKGQFEQLKLLLDRLTNGGSEILSDAALQIQAIRIAIAVEKAIFGAVADGYTDAGGVVN